MTFCKEYSCYGFEMAEATSNTMMKISSVAGSSYLGCGRYVVFPKGQMYCAGCYSWKALDQANKAWAISKAGQLIEPFLVCEGCSKEMACPHLVSSALCGEVHASQMKPKHASVKKMLGKWLRPRNVPQSSLVEWD